MTADTSRNARLLRLATLLLLVAVLYPMFLAYQNNWLAKFESDYWEHVAAINAFQQNPTDPSLPVETTLSLRSLSPYHFFWAKVASGLGIAPLEIMVWAGITNILLLVYALSHLKRRLYPDASDAQLFFFVFAVFSLWGKAPPFSGQYHLPLLPSVSPYPSFMAFSLSIIALSFWADFLRKPGALRGSATIVLFAAVMSCHQLVFAYFLVPSSLVIGWYFGEGKIKTVVFLLGVLFTALLLFLCWPYVKVGELLQIAWRRLSMFQVQEFARGDSATLKYMNLKPFGDYPIGWFYSEKVIWGFGPSMLCIATLTFITDKRRRIMFFCLIAIPAFFWALSAVVPWPVAAWRFSPFMAFWLQVCLASFFIENAFRNRVELGVVRTGLLCAFLALGATLLTLQLRRANAEYGQEKARNIVAFKEDIEKFKALIPAAHRLVGRQTLEWSLISQGFNVARHIPKGKWQPSKYSAPEVNLFADGRVSAKERCLGLEKIGITHLVIERGYRLIERSDFLDSWFTPGAARWVYEGSVLKLAEFRGCANDAET